MTVTLVWVLIAWLLIDTDHLGAAWIALAVSAVPFALTGYLAHLEQRAERGHA